MNHSSKRITIPVDGSKNSLRSLDYLSLIYGAKHDLKVLVCYILPALPLIFEDKKPLTKEERRRLKAIRTKNIEIAHQILKEAKEHLMKKGFDENCINADYHQKKQTVAKDVRHYALEDKSQAILMARHGRTELRAPFMGEVSRYMVECCQNMPVWVTGGAIKSKKVLICVDSSDNSLRAVNHAGLMLAGTDCTLTIFHTIRHIMSFIPKELLDEAPDLEEIWQKRAGSEMTPFIEESKAMLVNAGIGEERIEIKIINGTGSAARDILDEAKEGDYGTIVLGRRGISKMKELFMGSVTHKVLQASHGVCLWIVQ